MEIIDSHCHIHEPWLAEKYDKSVDQLVKEAKEAGVLSFISVGTSAESSRLAVEFAQAHGTYASLALHPHEVSEKSPTDIDQDFATVEEITAAKHAQVVAIGECGLDYYYHKETEVQAAQVALFRRHLDLAVQYDLPLIFHIRDAFPDFFAIIDEYSQAGTRIRGVVHSFTAGMDELNGCLKRGFYLGVNGIMTFTKNEDQLSAARAIPRDRLLFETDAPFLTPKPFRGKMCEIRHIVETVKFMSELRNEPLDDLAAATTQNARELFKL